MAMASALDLPSDQCLLGLNFSRSLDRFSQGESSNECRNAIAPLVPMRNYLFRDRHQSGSLYGGERQPLAISRARPHQPGWLGLNGPHRAPLSVLSRGGAVRSCDVALLAVPARRASDAARGRGHILRLREGRAGRRRCFGSGAGFDPALLVGDFLGAQQQGSLAAIAAARIHTEAWTFVI